MKLKAIDLFAGAGGLTLAAHQAGVEVLAAIEFDDAAANTYRKNFIEQKKHNIDLREGTKNGDINNVDPIELRESLGLAVGDLDLILGGPPCQGFSSHRFKNSGVNDPRNKLLLRYFEFVHEFRPKVFLVENVAGLLWKRHESFLLKFIKLSNHEGYEIRYCDILNARDYGVPQSRKRVFILGVRKDADLKELQFPPLPTHFPNTSGKSPTWRSASVAFEAIPADIAESYIENYFVNKLHLSFQEAEYLVSGLEAGEALPEKDPCNIHMQPTPQMIQRFLDTPLNGSREDAGERHQLKCHANGYKGHKDVYGRVFIHKPSNTITTGCNNPSKGRFVHPWKNHGITLRHAARLQSFPDWFNFYGSSTEQAKQIGNAVPPRFGAVIVSHICKKLKK